MRTLIGLLILILWNPAVQAANAGCNRQAKIVRACFAYWDKEYAKVLDAIPSPNIHTAQALIESARSHNVTMYESTLTILDCVRRGEKLNAECSYGHTDLVQGVQFDLLPYAEKMKRVQTDARAKIAEYVAAANAMNDRQSYMLTCHVPRPVADGGFQVCYVVDRGSADYKFIPGTDIDILPITVGVTRSCTFFVDDRGRVITADHCGEAHMKNAFLFGNELRAISANRTDHLAFSRATFDIGPRLEDIAVFAPADSGITGRSFYYLALDPKLKGNGCEPRMPNVVACSRTAMRKFTGLRAEMLSFPAPYYTGDKGEFRREAPRSVLHTSGLLIYDSSFDRFVVQMYAQEGASGSPVFISAGTSIGGFMLDKPLVLGPLTGVSGTPGRMMDGMTDNIGMVASVRVDRLLQVLNAPQNQFAGWVLRGSFPLKPR